jgi:hypothetical protein
VTALTKHVGINGHWIWSNTPLPAITTNGACSEKVILLCPPGRDRALWTPTVLMPQLEHRFLASIFGAYAALGLIIKTFWVVGRPKLQGVTFWAELKRCVEKITICRIVLVPEEEICSVDRLACIVWFLRKG